MNTVRFELPWPPSLNHYYRHVGPRVLISRQGRLYRERVTALIQSHNIKTFDCKVALDIQLYPPDSRRRDVDNVLKIILDVLTIGGLYPDDSYVKQLKIEMREPYENGFAVVTAMPYAKENR